MQLKTHVGRHDCELDILIATPTVVPVVCKLSLQQKNLGLFQAAITF